ncbi:hypothetical protein H257_00752 [Aphanomyces astaci]|uniref:Uncharacterized protein n=1 Tax=Aphanomyces astaci TaxID=112090 RepID=W4HBV2_APHAT|nr:hypothetical protein H257_00752 [Aphanomyces astaci]ETV89490.1 hypothetical protein H257_00752 [Aphanomyces astaci]|eukprot:XP_009821890.1 hypothetical protein H257_00752 [Aphanomyces astaci]
MVQFSAAAHKAKGMDQVADEESCSSCQDIFKTKGSGAGEHSREQAALAQRIFNQVLSGGEVSSQVPRDLFEDYWASRSIYNALAA